MIKDVYFAYFILFLGGVTTGAYLLRSLLRGRARHDRTDADGGSVFLNKASMEMGYWLVAPVINGLASAGVSANVVTLLCLVPAIGAAVAGALGWFGLACVLATMAAYGDIVDGLLARKLGTSSEAGEVLDAAIDRYGEFLFLAGLAIYYRTHWIVLALVLLAILGSFMVSYSTAKAEAMGVKPPRGSMRRAERSVYLYVAAGLTSVWKVFFGDSASHLLHELPIILGVTVVGVVSNVSVVQRCALIMQALRERAADRKPPSVDSNPPSGGIIGAPNDQAGSL